MSGAVIGDGDEADECDEDDGERCEDEEACEAEAGQNNFFIVGNAAVKQAYEQVKGQYESLPDGSLEKGAVKLAMDGLARSMELFGENE